jgi:hypothetical protein
MSLDISTLIQCFECRYRVHSSPHRKFLSLIGHRAPAFSGSESLDDHIVDSADIWRLASISTDIVKFTREL